MKIANLNGRASVIAGAGAIDLATASNGRFGPDVMAVYEQWPAVAELAATLDPATAEPFDETSLGAPVPAPRQVFAIGLNYRAHAAEANMVVPDVPATFTKFPACINSPFGDVELSGDTVDWEVELVVVIGTRADRVAEADAWAHVAGLTVGQDVSDRTVQMAAGGQFSLGKSFRGFAPLGPWVVGVDEVPDPDDLGLGCSIDGEVVQSSRTSNMILSVSRLIADLSAVLPLLPGDIIFTGTPEGVGLGRKPPRYLKAGEVVESWIEGIGTIRNRFVARA